MMRTYMKRRGQFQLIEGVLDRCRLCLSKVAKKIPIFNETNNLAVRIMLCVGFEINSEESLPNFICQECLTRLNQCYEFKKKCSLASLKLKAHMRAVKLKEIGNTLATEPKIADCQFKTPKEKRQRIANYEELVSETLSETSENEHRVPIQVDANITLQPVVPNTENVQMNKEEVPVQVQESVIKYISEKKVIEERIPSPEPQPPDMSGFLSSVLLECKILKKTGNDILLEDSSLRTLEIETGDKTVITLDMFEVDEETPVDMENSETTQQEENNKLDQLAAIQAKSYSLPMCLQCGKTFASGSTLRRHARVHSGERPYECSVCHRCFAQKEVMARHVLVHMDQRPHKCPKCPKSFTQRRALDSHVRSHAEPHQRPMALYRCTKCSKVFLHASGLSRHMMTHNGRVFECDSCSRRFTDHSSLVRHLRVMHRTDDPSATVIAPNPSAALREDGVCT